jgi:hypothetical protein
MEGKRQRDETEERYIGGEKVGKRHRRTESVRRNREYKRKPEARKEARNATGKQECESMSTKKPIALERACKSVKLKAPKRS